MRKKKVCFLMCVKWLQIYCLDQSINSVCMCFTTNTSTESKLKPAFVMRSVSFLVCVDLAPSEGTMRHAKCSLFFSYRDQVVMK